MPFPIAAAIAGGVSLINGFLQGDQNRKNRLFQDRENEKQRQFSLDMWNRNNEYNLPVNQMARLRQAGVNPHLAFENGTGMNVSNAPAQASTSPLPAGEAPKLNIGELSQLMLMKAQKENIEADTEKKKAEAGNVNVSTGIAKVELNYKEQKLVSEIGLTEQQIAESKSRIESAIVQNDKMREEIEKIKSEKKLTDQQVENLKKSLALIAAQVQQTLADADLKREQKTLIAFQKGNLEAQTRLLTAQAGREEIKMKYDDRLLDVAIKEAFSRIKHTDAVIQNISFSQLNTIVGGLVSMLMKGNSAFYTP